MYTYICVYIHNIDMNIYVFIYTCTIYTYIYVYIFGTSRCCKMIFSGKLFQEKR